MTDRTKTQVAVIADVLSSLGMPGTATLAALVEAKLEERRDAAREILLDQISAGDIAYEQGDIDPFIEMFLRFERAVRDGAARRNLKLMAQVFAGQKRHRALEPDAFRVWCTVLQDLSRDEILGLGAARTLVEESKAKGEELRDNFRQELRASPALGCFAPDDLDALCARLVSKGLFIPISAWGATAYTLSPTFHQLCALVSVFDPDP